MHVDFILATDPDRSSNRQDYRGIFYLWKILYVHFAKRIERILKKKKKSVKLCSEFRETEKYFNIFFDVFRGQTFGLRIIRTYECFENDSLRPSPY